MPAEKKDFGTYLVEAINENYLITMAVTSYTQAKRPTQNLPFGLGKTTLALELNYLLQGGDPTYNDPDIWEKTFASSVYNPLELVKLLKPGTPRKNCVVWDDVQATAPAEQGVPRAIRRLANFLSTERPEVACLIFTTPNVNQISSPLRKLVNFEVIVSERGLYEVHKIVYMKDYRRPLVDRSRLQYMEELDQTLPFPPLRPNIQERYDLWRIKEKVKLYPALENDLDVYLKARDFTPTEPGEQVALEGRVIKLSSHSYGIAVPSVIGEQLHGNKVKLLLTT